jgi:hypothetical protein
MQLVRREVLAIAGYAGGFNLRHGLRYVPPNIGLAAAEIREAVDPASCPHDPSAPASSTRLQSLRSSPAGSSPILGAGSPHGDVDRGSGRAQLHGYP